MLVKTSLEAEVGGSEFGSQSDYKVGGRRVMTGLFATNNHISDRTCTQNIPERWHKGEKSHSNETRDKSELFPSPTQVCVAELWKARPYSVTTDCLYVLY